MCIRDRVCSYDEEHGKPEIISAAVKNHTEDTGIDLDMELIWMELREKTSPQGAYCQDFATFKQLYRFVERGLMRLPISAYTCLLYTSSYLSPIIPAKSVPFTRWMIPGILLLR